MRVSIDLQHLELSDFKMFASIMGENLYLTKFNLHFPNNKSGICIYTFIVNCIFFFVNCLFIYLSSIGSSFSYSLYYFRQICSEYRSFVGFMSR